MRVRQAHDRRPERRLGLPKAVEWLLEGDQPSVRYLTLTGLLERDEEDPEVVVARDDITKRGWAHDILARQNRGGWWLDKESFYQPKYLSTNWMLLVLSDLGLTRREPRVAKSCELWIDRFAKEDGGFGADNSKRSHLCIVGNTARALVKFGYTDHPRVRSAFQWMVREADDKGGWSCHGSGRNLDSWEPMSAFAVYPRSKWTKGMKRVVESGAEFYLQRRLHIQGPRYEPWYRFHYPVHYYYDVLVGLDFMTALGYTGDKRLETATRVMKKRMLPDGRWKLDGVHPDIGGKMKAWYKKHPKHLPTPSALEVVGKPSKMITLRALQVMKRFGKEPRHAG